MTPSPAIPSIQLETIWKCIALHSSICKNDEEEEKQYWSHFKTIMDNITNANYTEVLKCPHGIVNKCYCVHW